MRRLHLPQSWTKRRERHINPHSRYYMGWTDAVCETYCETWRIIDQVYGHVKEVRAMTTKELEDLEDLFHIFKGHVEALEAMTARPDAVKELMSFRDYIELLLPHLRRGDLSGDAVAKITSMRHRVNKLREELACRC